MNSHVATPIINDLFSPHPLVLESLYPLRCLNQSYTGAWLIVVLFYFDSMEFTCCCYSYPPSVEVFLHLHLNMGEICKWKLREGEKKPSQTKKERKKESLKASLTDLPFGVHQIQTRGFSVLLNLISSRFPRE